jgi:hypothetical protein
MSHEQDNHNTHDGKPSMTEAFRRFHAENPHVLDRLRDDVRAWTAAGKRRVGIQMFLERVRWDESMSLAGDGDFRISNNHAAFYSRALMLLYPDLAGALTTSHSPEADAWAADFEVRLIAHRSRLVDA